jgi:opacity protein-like surface antigen
MKVALIAGLSVLAMASTASAEGWYVQGNAGLSVGGKADADLSATDGTDTFSASQKLDLDSGWLASAAIGRQGGPVRWDAEFVYSTNDLKDITLSDGTDSMTVTGVSVSQAAVFANVYYDFMTDSSMSPYVGAGLGYGATRFKAEDEDDVDSGLAWQLKAGVSIKQSDALSWDIGYRYMRLADFQVSDSEGGIDTNLKVKTDLHALTVGARFSF